MSSQYDMGYVGNSGYAPGYALANNNAANMMIAKAALGRAAAAERLGSGIYLDEPAILAAPCYTKSPGVECGQGYSDKGSMCCMK